VCSAVGGEKRGPWRTFKCDKETRDLQIFGGKGGGRTTVEITCVKRRRTLLREIGKTAEMHFLRRDIKKGPKQGGGRHS